MATPTAAGQTIDLNATNKRVPTGFKVKVELQAFGDRTGATNSEYIRIQSPDITDDQPGSGVDAKASFGFTHVTAGATRISGRVTQWSDISGQIRSQNDAGGTLEIRVLGYYNRRRANASA